MSQEVHDGLDFSSADDGGYTFGLFSVKFSTDGRELVAGSSDDSIYVYDLETNKVSLRILAHVVKLTAVIITSYDLLYASLSFDCALSLNFCQFKLCCLTKVYHGCLV